MAPAPLHRAFGAYWRLRRCFELESIFAYAVLLRAFNTLTLRSVINFQSDLQKTSMSNLRMKSLIFCYQTNESF